LGDFTATPEGVVLISDFEISDISLNKNNSIVGRSIIAQTPGKEGQVCCRVVPSNREEYLNHSCDRDHDDHDDHDDDYNHIRDGGEDHGVRTEVGEEDFDQTNAELTHKKA